MTFHEMFDNLPLGYGRHHFFRQDPIAPHRRATTRSCAGSTGRSPATVLMTFPCSQGQSSSSLRKSGRSSGASIRLVRSLSEARSLTMRVSPRRNHPVNSTLEVPSTGNRPSQSVTWRAASGQSDAAKVVLECLSRFSRGNKIQVRLYTFGRLQVCFSVKAKVFQKGSIPQFVA